MKSFLNKAIDLVLLGESSNDSVVQMLAALAYDEEADDINKLLDPKDVEKLISLLHDVVIRISEEEGINLGDLNKFLEKLVTAIWNNGGV